MLVHAQDATGNPVLTPISQLKIGDKVLAKSEWKPEGENLSYESITDIISTSDSVQKWVHLTLADGKTIDATEGHPFNTPDGWRDAILLKKGGELILKGEHGEPKSIQIADVKVEDRRLTTYNLEVANAHTFFVGEDAVLVHNSTIGVGPHAGKSIPGHGTRDFTADERRQINEIGYDTGCHTCGSTDPGTKSGNFIVDHQPPISLNPSNLPFRFYPHCKACSCKQGGDVSAHNRRKK